jgi:DNA-binding transcriptional MerR regulator
LAQVSGHLARLSFIRRARNLGFTFEAVDEQLTLSDDKSQSREAVDGIARVAETRAIDPAAASGWNYVALLSKEVPGQRRGRRLARQPQAAANF